MIHLTLSVSYNFFACMSKTLMVSCVIELFYVLFSLVFALRGFICNNTVCVLFGYFSLEGIVGLESISGKSTIEQLLLYSN